MLSKLLTLVLLYSTANLVLSGCTRTVTVSLYESGELRHNVITGVTLKTGRQETFTERGGRFDAGRKVVSGITAHRDTADYELDELAHVKTIARVSGLAMTCDVPSHCFPGYYKDPKPGKVMFVITRDSLRHVFDGGGGRIDIAAGAITGYNKFNTPISVRLDKVDLVGVKKPDKVATGLIILGVAAGLFIGVAALTLHDMDFKMFGDSSWD